LGHVRVPRSANLAGWGGLWLAIASIRTGDGPTVLVLGGNHGDEYEGQFATLDLINRVTEEEVTGHLIVMPCLSPEASRAGTRLWPSGANFNRSFPGSPEGETHEQLADFLTRVLFPLADVVIDLHSGGRSMVWAPMSHMHVVDDREQRRAMLEGMLAWNSDFNLLYTDIAGSGLLPSEAEAQGKLVITTEAGGGGFPTRQTLDAANDGLRNVLRHVGVLVGETVTRADLGKEPAVVLSATDPSQYALVHETGFYETLISPGDTVVAGQPVGRLHHVERLDRQPDEVVAPTDGVVAACRAFPWVDQGTCVAVVGIPTDTDSIL
jgi:predicted deacylase